MGKPQQYDRVRIDVPDGVRRESGLGHVSAPGSS